MVAISLRLITTNSHRKPSLHIWFRRSRPCAQLVISPHDQYRTADVNLGCLQTAITSLFLGYRHRQHLSPVSEYEWRILHSEVEIRQHIMQVAEYLALSHGIPFLTI